MPSRLQQCLALHYHTPTQDTCVWVLYHLHYRLLLNKTRAKYMRIIKTMQLLGYGARYKAKTILGLIRRNLRIGKESTGGMGGGGGGGGGHTKHTLRVLSQGQNKEDARKSLSVFYQFLFFVFLFVFSFLFFLPVYFLSFLFFLPVYGLLCSKSTFQSHTKHGRSCSHSHSVCDVIDRGCMHACSIQLNSVKKL